MTNSCAPLHSEQAKDTRVVFYIFHICVQFGMYVANYFMCVCRVIMQK